MKRVILILILILASGCATTGKKAAPGSVKYTFDKSTGVSEIVMMPIRGCSATACILYIALRRNSDMPDDQIVLDVIVAGPDQFKEDGGLHFKSSRSKPYHILPLDPGTKTDPKKQYLKVGELLTGKERDLYFKKYYEPRKNGHSRKYLINKRFIKIIDRVNRNYIKIDLKRLTTGGGMKIPVKNAIREFVTLLNEHEDDEVVSYVKKGVTMYKVKRKSSIKKKIKSIRREDIIDFR